MATEQPVPPADPLIEDVASGQRLIIYAILINLAAVALSAAVGDIAGLLALVGVFLAIWGLLRLATGLRYSLGVKIILIVLAFIPLVSLVMLLVVNGRATKALREAGYHVGLLGARKA